MRLRNKPPVMTCQYCGVEVEDGVNGVVWETEDEYGTATGTMAANCTECDEGFDAFMEEFDIDTDDQYISVADMFGIFRDLNLRLAALEGEKVEEIKEQYE